MIHLLRLLALGHTIYLRAEDEAGWWSFVDGMFSFAVIYDALTQSTS